MNRQFSAVGLFDPRIIKFLSVGLLNTVFGYAVYASLIFVGVPYLTALFVATVTGVIFNYFSFGRMVFTGHGGWFVFGKFVVAYGVVYAANAALLRVLTKDFIFSPYVGQVICIPLCVLLSWSLMNYLVYQKD
ncbi:MAG: GtrA family protein [Chlorobium sp.]|nr:GtrA family protein [Chlorobium sp.]